MSIAFQDAKSLNNSSMQAGILNWNLLLAQTTLIVGGNNKSLMYFLPCIYLCQLVEAPKQLVERGHELGCGQLLRQRGEVDNVGVQNGDVVVTLHVHLL